VSALGERGPREALIRAAIERAYGDAELAPPTIGQASRIVPLKELVAGQDLERTERPAFTRREVSAFLGDQLPYAVEMNGEQDDDLSGYLYANRSGGWILVSQDEPVTRRRFTVAHELGHFLLHARPAFGAGATVFSEAQPVPKPTEEEDALGEDGRVEIERASMQEVPDQETWEVEANQFAAELLMPADLCRALVSQYAPLCGDRRNVLAKRLAGELLVSQQAMSRRLADLELGVA
jgi:Zn-dependent peptidase ImmA (M78 family)